MVVLSQNSFSECVQVPKEIEQGIQVHLEKSRAGENCSKRIVYSDNELDLVIYTLLSPCFKSAAQPAGSCGNHYFSAFISSVNNNVNVPIVVGGKNRFHPTEVSRDGDVVKISGFNHVKGDASCCPSGKDTKFFKMTEAGLVDSKL